MSWFPYASRANRTRVLYCASYFSPGDIFLDVANWQTTFENYPVNSGGVNRPAFLFFSFWLIIYSEARVFSVFVQFDFDNRSIRDGLENYCYLICLIWIVCFVIFAWRLKYVLCNSENA